MRTSSLGPRVWRRSPRSRRIISARSSWCRRPRGSAPRRPRGVAARRTARPDRWSRRPRAPRPARSGHSSPRSPEACQRVCHGGGAVGVPPPFRSRPTGKARLGPAGEGEGRLWQKPEKQQGLTGSVYTGGGFSWRQTTNEPEPNAGGRKSFASSPMPTPSVPKPLLNPMAT